MLMFSMAGVSDSATDTLNLRVILRVVFQRWAMATNGNVTVGFPRMHCEPNELRDFLPPADRAAGSHRCRSSRRERHRVRHGSDEVEYSVLSPCVVVTDEAGAYRQDIVVVLRAPDGKYDLLRRGAVLVLMLHFATRPARVRLLREMGIDAVSLDLIRDDDGARLIENLRSVAWNGIGAAFAALERELAGARGPTAFDRQGPDHGRRPCWPTCRRVRDEVRRRRPQRRVLRGPGCPASK